MAAKQSRNDQQGNRSRGPDTHADEHQFRGQTASGQANQIGNRAQAEEEAFQKASGGKEMIPQGLKQADRENGKGEVGGHGSQPRIMNAKK